MTIWFRAICLISLAKTGLSSLARKRQLSVSYSTAQLMHHKIMDAMAQRESTHRLQGAVQLDDAYMGGERIGGKVGRGSENKVPFVAAVSLSEDGNPLYVKLPRLSGFSRQAVGEWARTALMPDTLVTSDGRGCFCAVTDAGCLHSPIVGGQRKPRDLPEFTGISTVLGNLMTTLAGAFHVSDYAKYAGFYLAAFAYRFNRHFDLRGLVVRLVIDVVRAKPKTLWVIRQAEHYC